MQIFQASQAGNDGAFLHVGYTSAYGDRDSWEPIASGSTGVTPSPPRTGATSMFDLNIAVILLFFAGVILLRMAKAMPPLRRRLATAIIVSLALIGLFFPAISSAVDYVTDAIDPLHVLAQYEGAAGVRNGR